MGIWYENGTASNVYLLAADNYKGPSQTIIPSENIAHASHMHSSDNANIMCFLLNVSCKLPTQSMKLCCSDIFNAKILKIIQNFSLNWKITFKKAIYNLLIKQEQLKLI